MERSFEEFCENPQCRECHASMSLNPECEWPEDPRLWLCTNCMTNLVELLLPPIHIQPDPFRRTYSKLATKMMEAAKPREKDLFGDAAGRVTRIADEGLHLGDTARWNNVVDVIRELSPKLP